MRTPVTTAASVAVFVDAFIWLVGTVPTLYHTFIHKALPNAGGIRLMGGPFESLGIDALIVAGIIYIFASSLKILAAYWLWYSRRDGAVLGIILLGFSIIFWYGFALPIGPLVGIVELVLIVLAWKTLDIKN
jgi:hypothetical protein